MKRCDILEALKEILEIESLPPRKKIPFLAVRNFLEQVAKT